MTLATSRPGLPDNPLLGDSVTTAQSRRSSPGWIAGIAAVAVVATLVRAMFFTPIEARQG